MRKKHTEIRQILDFDFSKEGRERALETPFCKDWPVVYIINNDKEMYIGETSNFATRFAQHLESRHKKGLKHIHVIVDSQFNKSAILDIEQTLIRLCGADRKFVLRNGNSGQSAAHNYYQREMYLNKIEGDKSNIGIWEELRNRGLADSPYDCIVNSDLFAYSPYTALTSEQEDTCYRVLDAILNGLNNPQRGGITCVVNGSAGTGKTILAIYLMTLLVNFNKGQIDVIRDDDEIEEEDLKKIVLHKLNKYIKNHGCLSIAYVVPMNSIRQTIQAVFTDSKNGLKGNMVIGPVDVTKNNYDILLVDESHRLHKRRFPIPDFDEACNRVGMDPHNVNALDWIVKCSKHRVLFYDQNQTIKGSDITHKEFEKSIEVTNIIRFNLTSQMRCKGGQLYIDYLNSIFNCTCESFLEMDNDYDVKIFDNPNKMINKIKQLDGKYKLCRNVAGYSCRAR